MVNGVFGEWTGGWSGGCWWSTRNDFTAVAADGQEQGGLARNVCKCRTDVLDRNPQITQIWQKVGKNKTCELIMIIFYIGPRILKTQPNVHLASFCLCCDGVEIYILGFVLPVFLTPVHDWVVLSNIFHFHPYLGKWSNLTNIFQMGWNHQLDDFQWLARTQRDIDWPPQLQWMKLQFFSPSVHCHEADEVPPPLPKADFFVACQLVRICFSLFSKAVSTHLWNTPLNLYQQAIKGFLS